MLRAGYTGSFFHNDDTTRHVRQSVPRRPMSRRPRRAGATRCRRAIRSFGQRHGVGQAAGRSRATAYVSMGSSRTPVIR